MCNDHEAFPSDTYKLSLFTIWQCSNILIVCKRTEGIVYNPNSMVALWNIFTSIKSHLCVSILSKHCGHDGKQFMNEGIHLMLTNTVYVFNLHCVAGVSLFMLNRSALPETTFLPASLHHRQTCLSQPLLSFGLWDRLWKMLTSLNCSYQ